MSLSLKRKAKDTDFIVLHHSVMEKFLYSRPQYLALWIYILFKANHEPEYILYWDGGKTIESGAFITTRSTISSATGIPHSTVERILKAFVNMGLIEQQTRGRCRLITVRDFNQYQECPKKKTDTNSSKWIVVEKSTES